MAVLHKSGVIRAMRSKRAPPIKSTFKARFVAAAVLKRGLLAAQAKNHLLDLITATFALTLLLEFFLL
jgi:hypothetical protein